jgi:hypothetical protein
MKELHKIIIILLFSFNLFSENSYKHWLQPSPSEQLDLEGIDDKKGVGRIFMPAMTDPENEPFYFIYRKNKLVKSDRMGTSSFLLPGFYTVKYGSGDQTQLMSQSVEIYKENVSFPKINWSGLTIKIIDENRNSIDNRYEIFKMSNAESFGFGYGAREEVGEHLLTWILKPGTYKITLNGQSFNTYIDFTTVELVKGELVQLTMVVDSESGHLIGAGILNQEENILLNTPSKLSTALHLNANASSDNSTDKNHPSTRISLIGQLDNKYIYEKNPFHIISKDLFDLGISKETDTDFRISTDNISLRNTGLYYFSRFFGSYARIDLQSHFFTEKIYSQDGANFIKLSTLGDTLNLYRNVKSIDVKPPFFPISIKEGLGFNFRILNHPQANLNIRSGFGMRQDIYRNVYSYIHTIHDENNLYDNYNVYQQNKSNFQEGIEISVLGNFQLFRDVSYNTNADILFPFDKQSSKSIDWEQTANLKLFKYLSVDYRFNISYNKDVSNWFILNHNLFLRITYFLY